MARLVEARAKFTGKGGLFTSGGQRGVDWAERVAKHVPTEVLAFFWAAHAHVPQVEIISPKVASWVVFGLGLIATISFVFWASRPSRPKILNLVVSSLAFVIWVYATTGKTGPLSGIYDPAIATIILSAFTLFSGFLAPRTPGNRNENPEG